MIRMTFDKFRRRQLSHLDRRCPRFAEGVNRVLPRQYRHRLFHHLLPTCVLLRLLACTLAEQFRHPAGYLLQRPLGSRVNIFYSGFFLFHVRLSFGSYGNDRNTTGQFCQAFLELFLVVIAVGLLDLFLDLGNPSISISSFSCTFNNGRIVLSTVISWLYPSDLRKGSQA